MRMNVVQQSVVGRTDHRPKTAITGDRCHFDFDFARGVCFRVPWIEL